MCSVAIGGRSDSQLIPGHLLFLAKLLTLSLRAKHAPTLYSNFDLISVRKFYSLVLYRFASMNFSTQGFATGSSVQFTPHAFPRQNTVASLRFPGSLNAGGSA